MIGRLTGRLAEKSPPQLLIDVNGVGYEIDVPMSSFYNLPALGERVTLLTHFVVREDAQVLFGFLTHDERATFRLLVKISGIGRKTAERLLLELKGKLGDSLAAPVSVARGAQSDILQALVALGYNDREAGAALKALPTDVGVSDGIKLALRALGK